MTNFINDYLKDSDYFSFLLSAAGNTDEVLILSKLKEDLELKEINQKKYDEANAWANFDINYDESIADDADDIFEDKPVLLNLNATQIKKLVPKKINSVLLSSGQFRSYDILSNPVTLDSEWELIHESLFSRITKYIKKTEQLKIIEHLEYNFKFIVHNEITIRGIEIIDTEIKNDVHDISNFLDLESDELPETVEGISHSVEKYNDAIVAGNFSDKFDGNYTLPGHGGHYHSCMKTGLVGCFGSNIENADKNQKMAVMQDARHDQFNKQYDTSAAGVGSGSAAANPITHMKKIFLACKRMSCDKCFKKSVNHEAKNASLRMFAFVCFLISNFGLNEKRYFNHSVVSIPLSMCDDFKDEKLRKAHEKTMLADLKILGVVGGIMLFHPYRFSKKLKHAYWSPHYHFILCGYTESKDVIEFNLKNGFVYVAFPNIDNNGKPFVGKDRLYHTLRYILSHAGINHSKHTVRYFGLANNRKFKTAEILSNAVDSLDEIKDQIKKIVNPIQEPKYVKFDREHVTKKFELQNIKLQKLTLRNEEIEKILVDKVQYPEINDTLTGDICDDITNFLLDNSVLDYNLIANAPNSLSDSEKNSHAVLIKTIHNVTVSRFNPVDYQYTKEKCYSKTSVFVLVSSTNTNDLCRLCNFKAKALMPIDESRHISNIEIIDDQNLINFHDLDPDYGPYQLTDIDNDKIFLTLGKIFRYQNRFDFFAGFPYFDNDEVSLFLRHDIKILEPGLNYEKYHPGLKQELNFSIDDSKMRAIKNHIKTKIYDKNLSGEIEDHINYFCVAATGLDIPYEVRPKPVLLSHDRSQSKKPIRESYKTTNNIQKLSSF